MRRHFTYSPWLYSYSDYLSSTVATSNSSGNFSGQEWYHAYGRYRGGHELGTENRFTAPKGLPKLDATGLMYYNARYYDPELGHFLSPDTLVPDASNLFDGGQKIKLDMVVLFGRFLKKLVKGYNGSPMQTNMVISSKVSTRVRQGNLYLGKN